MSDDDLQEIISRPPSHPIATTLLVTGILGTILAISLVWMELFTEYLPTSKGGKSKSRTIAEQHIHDHYKGDFRSASPDLLVDVEKELGITNSVGGGLGLGSNTGGGDEGEGGGEGG